MKLEYQLIDSPATAERVGFHDSPTILIDGSDPFSEVVTTPVLMVMPPNIWANRATDSDLCTLARRHLPGAPALEVQGQR